MTNAVLRAILWAAVAVACALVAASWKFFRSRNRRTKKIAVITAVVLVALIVTYGIVRHQLSKYIRPGGDSRLREVAAFVENNRGRIESCGKRLAAIRALVARDGWLGEEQRTHEGDGKPALLFWVHELTGEEPTGGGPASVELSMLDQMVEWARAPSTVADTYGGQSLERLADVLDLADARYVVVGEATDVTPPKVRNVTFAKDGGVSGEFTAGRVAFRVAVIEWETGTVVATGNGTATSSKTVGITGSPSALADDLWRQTNVAALALGRRLLGAGR